MQWPMQLATSILLALAAPQAPVGAAAAIAEHSAAAAERPLSRESWMLQNSYNAFVAVEETPATTDMLKPAIAEGPLDLGKGRTVPAPIV